MKKLFFLSSLMAGLLTAEAQVKQERKVEDFTSIEVGSVFTIHLTQAETNSVQVSAKLDDQAHIKTEVKNGVLHISSDEKEVAEDAEIEISIKNLTSLEASGASRVKGQNNLKVDKLKIVSSGASAITLELTANAVDATSTGASSLKLTGSSTQLTADVSGAASFKGYEFQSSDVDVSTSGAANAKVSSNKKLNAQASGASSIRFKGTPVDKTINATGSATINNMESMEETNSSSDKKDTVATKTRKHHTRNFLDKDYSYWRGVDVFVNGYLSPSNEISLPSTYSYMDLDYGKSIGFAINVIEKDFHIYKNYVNLVTGFGMEFDMYSLKNQVTLKPTATSMAYTVDSISFDKNRLKDMTLNIPLMLAFSTNNDNHNHSFHIALGVIGGYKISSRTKQAYKIDGYEYTVVKKSDYNLNPFRLKSTVRVGYGDFALFANYSLTQLFQANKGPELYPFEVGCSFLFF